MTLAYLLVAFAHTNVYSVSNSTAGVGHPLLRRWQPLSSKQLHRAGITSSLAKHRGTYMWLLIRLSSWFILQCTSTKQHSWSVFLHNIYCIQHCFHSLKVHSTQNQP